MRESNNIPEVFGSMVFNEAAMEQYVAAEAVAAWRQCLEQDQPLTLEVANEIAAGHEAVGARAWCDAFHALVPAH